MSETFGSLESERLAEENLHCREIIKEVMSFGVSQRQIYFLISLLGLELENIEHMRDVTTLVKEMRENIGLVENPTVGFCDTPGFKVIERD